MPDFYLISKEQLKKLCLEKLFDSEKMDIQISVLSNPYKGPISKSIIKDIGVIADGFGEFIDKI